MVELSVAVGVLLVTVLSAFGSQMTSLDLIRTSRETNTAMSELQAAMESVITLQTTQIVAQFPPDQAIPEFSDRSLQSERIRPSYPEYVPGSPLPDPLQVVLEATWNDYGGRERTLRLASMRAR
jgi:hypothetical protein